MSHMILIDELALKEFVESNVYQSCQFETGANLEKALGGDETVVNISPRIVPTWKKGTLYLLQSRVETGYLLIDSKIFESLPAIKSKDVLSDDKLHVFQRICRFSLKVWNQLSFAPSEKWSQKTDCGVLFPYPLSKHTGFRVALNRGFPDRRMSIRHGTKHLFAFTSGIDEKLNPTEEQKRAYKKAFDELTDLRASLSTVIETIVALPEDGGYHPLILTDTSHEAIRYQPYAKWLSRLTSEQKHFVLSTDESPQRVEGPAGTGKTLCLLLRSFFLCYSAEQSNKEYRVLFVSHSEATKNATAIAFESLGEPLYFQRDRSHFLQTIALCTLQEWCGAFLGERDISNSQYLDQDALQSKEMRKLFIKDIVAKRISDDPKSIDYLSEDCKAFFINENIDYISELLQHEIGVMIKGRASENLETYLKLPLLAYCLPTKTANDKRFVYSLYTEYQVLLNDSGVFDTDDIVLSTLGRLGTPIWRRRKLTEGFDAIVIDETHLFNLNELSFFHHVLRDSKKPRIIFSIDRSQAPGERGITTRLVREVLTNSDHEEQETKTQLVFRNSPAIVKLAEAITSAGATLFTTFENPLLNVSSVISAADEAAAQDPKLWKCPNDAVMCDFVITRTKELCAKLKCLPNEVLLVAMTESLLPVVTDSLKAKDLKFVHVLHRGDVETVRQGAKERAIIVSHPDFVGGLEFRAVLIIGVDEGRVPQSEGVVNEESRHFLEFKACNRLYVAVSRARLVVELFYSAERGASSLLQHALTINAITEYPLS